MIQVGVLRVGRSPTEAEVDAVLSALSEANIEQLAVRVRKKIPAMHSYRFLIPFALECASSAEDWAAQNGGRRSLPQPLAREELIARAIRHLKIFHDPQFTDRPEHREAVEWLLLSQRDQPQIYQEAERRYRAQCVEATR